MSEGKIEFKFIQGKLSSNISGNMNSFEWLIALELMKHKILTDMHKQVSINNINIPNYEPRKV